MAILQAHKKSSNGLPRIIQDLSEHVERFDCKREYKRGKGILQINRRLGNRPLGEFRRQDGWEDVGEIRQYDKGPATLVNVTPGAPNYIKSLEEKQYKSVPVLLNAIRREAFRHEARKVFRKYLSAEIKQLEDDG